MSLVSLSLLVLCCAAPESVAAHSSTETTAATAEAVPTPHQVREAVRNLLQREATAKTPEEREAAIRDLTAMYQAVRRDTAMAESQRKYIKGKMYSRLYRIKQDLENDIKRRQEEAAKRAKREAASRADSLAAQETGAAGGAAVRDYGEDLVELIQETIAPSSWDVNGGPGSIIYYSNLQVLVVRAAGDVHGHVGGLFEGLRAVGP